MSSVTEDVHLDDDLNHHPNNSSVCSDSDDFSIESYGSGDSDDPYNIEWEKKLMEKYEKMVKKTEKWYAEHTAKCNADNEKVRRELKSGGPFKEFMTDEEFVAIDDSLLTNSTQCRLKLQSIANMLFGCIDTDTKVYLQLQKERTLVKFKIFN